VRSVADLDDSRTGRSPAGPGIAPEEFEVDDSVWGSDFHEFLEDGRPLILLHTWHVLHAFQHFFGINSVVPALLLGARDLWISVRILCHPRKNALTSWFMIQTMTYSRVKVSA